MKNNYSKIGTIIKHEYTSRVKSRGFIIGTLVAPLIIILFYGIMFLVIYMSENDTVKKIAVLDETGVIGQEFVLKDTAKFYLTDKTEKELNKEILDKNIDGYLVFNKEFLNSGKANVYTSGGGGMGFVNAIQSNARDILVSYKLKSIGADSSVIKLVDSGVSIDTKKVTKEGTKKDYSQVLSIVGYFLGLMIYMMMFIYGAFVMQGVIEEKSNRIVEVLASSARPFEIMFGKVIGISLVGLTQVLFWVLIASVLLALGAPIASMFVGNPASQMTAVQGMNPAMNPANQNAMVTFFQNFTLSPWVGVAFIFYFLAGYFIYSTLFAAIGSAVDQEQDARQLQMPITLPLLIPLLAIGNVIANPDGVFATALSLFPFFTPILMIVRITATHVPAWQIALSVVLLAGTFRLCLWFASRIYRVGILTYGKKASHKDMIKWFRMKE